MFSEDKRKLQVVRVDQQLLKEESGRVHEALTESIARKDQLISSLETELTIVQAKNQTLSRNVEQLQREAVLSAQSLGETHQQAVELRMQGWDFKAEVDRRGDKVLSSVQSRMGFVPSGIQKQVALLQMLKVP